MSNIRLFQASAASIDAALTKDYSAFADSIGARIPESFPPEHLDADALRWTLNLISDPGTDPRFAMYWVIVNEPGGAVLAGVCGFKGMPVDGVVELGYGILPEFRRRGLATAAVRALMGIAFERPEIVTVAAETLPDLVPSIGVLDKSGFTLLGPAAEPGVIRYAIQRSEYQAHRGAAALRTV
jgi:ribosomal-protein-alanine N-acetyltransferase